MIANAGDAQEGEEAMEVETETRTIRLMEPDNLSQEAIQLNMDRETDERDGAMGRGRGSGRG